MTAHDRASANARGRRGADALLLTALAAGATREDAAAAAGVSPSTVYRRLNDEGFRAALFAQRADIIDRATGRLADASTRAVDVLAELMDDLDTSPAVRVAAARTVLDHTRRWRAEEELERRLADLETRLTSFGDRL